jgi:hypothetical protein
VEGLGEIMDVKLTALVPTGEIVKALNPVLPKGLEIVGAVQLLQKPAALSSASYFFNVNNIDLNTAETMKEIFSRDTLPTTKKSKSGEKAINLWDYIDCLEKSYSEDSQCFRLRADVPAGTREGINPNVILAFLEQALGRTLSCSIKRINPEFLDEE